MARITPETAQRQRKICLQLFPLMLIGVFIFWMCGFFLINTALEVLNVNLNSDYFWISFLPMLPIFFGLFLNKPMMFDWMEMYVACIPVSFLYLTSAVITNYAYLPKPENGYVCFWMLISFIIVLFFRVRVINYKSIKKNLLKYNIDKEKGLYAPRLNNADVGALYKKTKNDNWVDKLKVIAYSIIIYLGPILIGFNISSAGSDNLKMMGVGLLFYLGSMVVGIYVLLLYYARLKCLYQIQKELGCKLRFS